MRNSKHGYGWLAIVLHWISAVGVIWMYFLGENIEHAKEDGPREAVISAISFHVSIGMLFFAFLLARLISSLTQVRPAPLRARAPSDDATGPLIPLRRALAKQDHYLILVGLFVQRLWLLMIGIQIITGPLLPWTSGRALKIFDGVQIPSPFPAGIPWLHDGLHDGLERMHALAPNLFWPLLILHLAGAAKHLLLDKDQTVQRMVVPAKQPE